MSDDWLVRQFEDHRSHLRAVAYRMLGSTTEADDAVQESWLRVARAGTGGVDNLGGWLTTVVARVCLDMLRSRTARREQPLPPEPAPATAVNGADPEREALLADTVGPALLVVLDTLAPAERLAFVLHDLFAVPFDEIAPLVGRSPAATRQLASRARRRVQGVEARSPGADDVRRQRTVVDAFTAASRQGDFEALLAVLDPEVVMRADAVAVDLSLAARSRGAAPLAGVMLGRQAVADVFLHRAKNTRRALIDGEPGLVWWSCGEVRGVFPFTVAGGRVVEIGIVMDPDRVSAFDIELLTD
ncbi:sigma-70 family RNA polymerase sigma factor [Jiangella sp. DSM 45060]|uniref:sigma-70 family RNA polymerase sigma factor n=1 Tax=Jiangella sp. DSM 45060 TaxID=1798224 RepID=UPI000879FDB6|nr:sigma-70 family RNA polymerase sigma factor [Jiangella sp. DSM 45060]SDT72348.1 RNA polymerase, sigma subunit, ECF family [Jiangella sp. DSM 45060]